MQLKVSYLIKFTFQLIAKKLKNCEKEKYKDRVYEAKKSFYKVPLFEVYKFVVKKFENLGFKFEEIWSIMPCSPNLNRHDLIKISKFYKKLKTKVPVLSVSRFRVPVQWAYKMEKSKKLVPHNTNFQLKRSQDVDNSYFDAGQFCIYPGAKFKKLNFISKITFTKDMNCP